MFRHKLRVIALLGTFLIIQGQNLDSPSTFEQSRRSVPFPIANDSILVPFFAKLDSARAGAGKVNIVHIGDSHIQADLFTAQIRRLLQKEFGNAGRGLVFPHSLAKANGAWDVVSSSASAWERVRVLSMESSEPVGVAGYVIKANSSQPSIELKLRDGFNAFTTVKILTPHNRNMITVSRESRMVKKEQSKPVSVVHQVKKGETLSEIASKYGVTVAKLKQANGTSSSVINPGKRLRIPVNHVEKSVTTHYEPIPLTTEDSLTYRIYRSETPLQKITLTTVPGNSYPILNGIILENRSAGVLYHAVGVNGAKSSDYLRFPLFFQQLPVLSPDLIVISLGTNEGFGRLESSLYAQQLAQMIARISEKVPSAPILLVTPPPSLFQKKYPNRYVEEYAYEMNRMAFAKGYAFWDLFEAVGGFPGIRANAEGGLIGADRIHYSKAGYEKQGTLFVDALLDAYQHYRAEKTE